MLKALFALTALTAASAATAVGAGTTLRDCAQCPELIMLPGGAFLMGSPEAEPARFSNEGPQRQVEVAPIAIGKTEVTFDQWGACVEGGGCSSLPEDEGWGRGDRPVINVSWQDVQDYISWISTETGQHYRLPSEAEWEYAARAGTQTVFHTGSTISTTQANFDGNFTYNGSSFGENRGQTAPVSSLPANPWGLHDVNGNVWEVVADCWHDSYDGAPMDGAAWMEAAGGDCTKAVLRGGSWSSQPEALRSAARSWLPREYLGGFIGFRVVREGP